MVEGWSVMTFVWMGLCMEKSKRYMYLMHCKEGADCPNAKPEEEDDFEEEFEELDDDALEFHTNIWSF